MAVTDLTGTKWRFNSQLLTPFPSAKNIEGILTSGDFVISSDSTYKYMYVQNTTGDNAQVLFFSKSRTSQTPSNPHIKWNNYYTLRKWQKSVDGTIIDIDAPIFEITGGTDATNATLIQWIQSNATQIIDSPVLPSFSDVEVTPHEGYITMTINGVDFNLKTVAAVLTNEGGMT